MKGSASNSFDAAASIGQYTGDIPKQDDDAQKDNLTPDQAIQMAEQKQAQREEATELMIDGSELATVPASQQYTDYEVSEGEKDELDSLFEGDTGKDSEHFNFLRKVQTRAQSEI